MKRKNVHELKKSKVDHHELSEVEDTLTEVIRRGTKEILRYALEAEIEAFREQYVSLKAADGGPRLVRNGYLPERDVQTGIGPVPVRVPRLRDRGGEDGEAIRYQSSLLPPYLRRTRSVEQLLPWLYLKGISTGDFGSTLASLLGEDAPGLSSSTIVRLKQRWEAEYEAWSKRSLADKRYVYLWADGIHASVRMESEKQCLLVVMGALEDGTKELVALVDGYRESTEGWLDLLRDLKRRGLASSPKLAVGDGALGFWKALHQVYPGTVVQRCWVHKTANVLNKLPKRVQPQAKARLKEIWSAKTRKDANDAMQIFEEAYAARYPKSVTCLTKDRDELLAFYDYPAEHWTHLRTTNPIESTFATIRLRTAKTRGCLSRTTVLTMMFRLALEAQKTWRRLNGYQHIAPIFAGVTYIDGIHPERLAA